MEKIYGWTGKILKVDLASGDLQTHPTIEFAEKYIGGRGFITKIYWDDVDPHIDALNPNNPLLLMTGPFSGTSAIAGSRWFISGKSPLLYPDQFGLGNLGGSIGSKMKAAGLDGIIILGKASKPIYLSINNGEILIKDAGVLI